MAKINGLRPRLGLTGGQKELQEPPDVSVIAASMRVVGSIHSTSVVTVAGTVLGTISSDNQVFVTKGGRVEGDVEAREVVLGGEVHGSVDARERLEIQESAVVSGELRAPRLIVHEGAEVGCDVSTSESSMHCKKSPALLSPTTAPGADPLAATTSTGEARSPRRGWIPSLAVGTRAR